MSVSRGGRGSTAGGVSPRGEGLGMGKGKAAYEEDAVGLPARRLIVTLGQRDELVGHALRLLGLGPRGPDRLVLDERGDQVAQQGLPVGAAARQVAEFDGAAGHGFGFVEEKGGGLRPWYVQPGCRAVVEVVIVGVVEGVSSERRPKIGNGAIQGPTIRGPSCGSVGVHALGTTTTGYITGIHEVPGRECHPGASPLGENQLAPSETPAL